MPPHTLSAFTRAIRRIFRPMPSDIERENEQLRAANVRLALRGTEDRQTIIDLQKELDLSDRLGNVMTEAAHRKDGLINQRDCEIARLRGKLAKFERVHGPNGRFVKVRADA